jgi:hypothetical protein
MQAIPNVAGKVARRLHGRLSGFAYFEGVDWHGFADNDLTDVQLLQTIADCCVLCMPTPCTICTAEE